MLDGQLAKINATLLSWLGYTRAELVGRAGPAEWPGRPTWRDELSGVWHAAQNRR
jgi:hypothetical protein